MCGTCKCAETLLHWIVKWWRLFPFILFGLIDYIYIYLWYDRCPSFGSHFDEIEKHTLNISDNIMHVLYVFIYNISNNIVN